MPRFNGTGPLGQGPMTGRGLGFCNNNAATGFRGVRGTSFKRGLVQRLVRWFGRGKRFGW